MTQYVLELEKRAEETGRGKDADLLRDLRGTWTTLAAELLPKPK
jgi:hypothetical protein